MKLLLTAINAKYIHSNPAVYSLRACASQWREHIEIAEYTINNRTEAILADLYRRAPEVIAFSCYIWNWNMVQELLTELPKVLPDTDIWLGGPEVSYNASEILEKYRMLSGIMVGEGENTFAELAAYYCKGDRVLSNIAGLCLPGEKPYFTAERELSDLNRIPFFYDDLQTFENRILYYESSRGCPFRCSYCLSSIDKRVRFRSMELVKKELQFFLDHQVGQVKFVDRTFNCNQEHACGIWQYLLEHDNGVTNFHFEVSADILTEKELDILTRMRPGLIQLEIGVQSTNKATIGEIHRNMNLDKLRKIVTRIHAGRNIHQHLDLIAGLPYEDYESFKRSFNEVYALKPDQLQLGFLKVLKGSYMHEMAQEYGIIYHSKPPYEVLYSKWLSYGEVLRLKQVEEMVEMYYNSNQFRHTLRFLVSVFKSPFECFEKLADYYEQKGYYVNAPARAYRYEVLLNFAKVFDAGREELYRELLTFDMYLREKCKRRPEFAGDLTPYREGIRALERKKGLEHIDAFYYPVWESDIKRIICRQEKPVFIRFCYEKRDPLNHDAGISVGEEDEKEYKSDSGSVG